MTLPIETDRLVLRRFTLDDVDDMVELASHPSVAQVGNKIRPMAAEVRKYLDWQNSLQPFEFGACFELGIELKCENKVIGFAGMIRKDNAQAEVGCALHIGYRGRGYATEAARVLISYGFEKLGLRRISADTAITNIGARKVAERLGMRRERHCRESEPRDGQLVDLVGYTIVADEWRGKEID
ncbi:MAG: GNAT family N-acetyltransferase [Candidatus Zixiibacteriota bacterium]|nr:MAG: GNAT family N-acetyltransferase [candidate division Zixibacteria bacterium]